MPGRPRKRAKQVAALEDKSIELLVELFVIMPSQWRDAVPEMSKDIRDPVGQLWLTAFIFSQEAMRALERLGDAVRRRANINGPSMLRDFADGMFADRDGAGGGEKGLVITPSSAF